MWFLRMKLKLSVLIADTPLTVGSPQIFRLYFYGTVLDLQRKWKGSHKLCPHPHSHFNPCYCIGMIYLLQMMGQNWHIYQLKSIIHIRVHSPCLSLSGLCACVCVPMCSCVFTYVETRSWHQVSSSTPFHLCFEKNVSYWSGAHKFGYTSWSGIHMLPPPCAGTAGYLSVFALTWVLGSKLRPFVTAGHVPNCGAIFPITSYFL